MKVESLCFSSISTYIHVYIYIYIFFFKYVFCSIIYVICRVRYLQRVVFVAIKSEVLKHTHLPKIMKMSVTGRNKLLSET